MNGVRARDVVLEAPAADALTANVPQLHRHAVVWGHLRAGMAQAQ